MRARVRPVQRAVIPLLIFAFTLLVGNRAAAQATTYGSGCSGTLPEPVISHTGSSTPGAQGAVHLTGAAPNATTVLIIGTSKTNSNGLPLPYDLTSFAGVNAGCSLQCSTDIMLVIPANASGNISLGFKNPAGFGTDLFFQFVVFESADPLSIVLTQGLQLHFTSAVTPDATELTFPPTVAGYAAADQMLTVTNDTSLPVTLNDALVYNGSAIEFSAAFEEAVPFVLAPGASTHVVVGFAPMFTGERHATLQLMQSGLPNGFAPASVELSGVGLGPVGAEILLNAGGPEYFDGNMQMWASDFGFTGGSSGTTTDPISGTHEDELYQSYREGTAFAYHFDLPVGTYDVALHFADPDATLVGERVFSVDIESATVLPDIDLVALAGADMAYVAHVSVDVSDGTLDIELSSSVGNAILSALEVRATIPALSLDPPALNFGALAEGQSLSLPVTVTNTGTATAIVDSLAFLIGPGGGAGHEFSVTILGETYTGSDTDITVPAALALRVGQSVVIDVTFLVTHHMENDVKVVFHGNFAPATLALAGIGGGSGNPFLHVVIDAPLVTVDYDGSGDEEVALDGSFSHTHEQEHEIAGYAWAEGAVQLGTAPVVTPTFGLGMHTVDLTISDDNMPPMTLTGSASFSVVSPSSVPGVLVLYYATGGTPSPLTLLDAPPVQASFAEIRDEMLVQDQGAVGGTTYSENVMVRMQASVLLANPGSFTFSVTGGSDSRLFVDGAPVAGPLALAAGAHTVEARFAIISLADLPVEVLLDSGSGPLPISMALLTHDEVAQKPVLNSMQTQGITLGGNAIEITGIGFFPAGALTVHWGDINLTAVDFTAETPTSIQFLSPAHATGVIAVTVQTPQGTSNALPFEYVADGTPPINFTELLPSLGIAKPTCGDWGPDGRFYVGTIHGRIFAITFDDNYAVTNVTSYLGISQLDNDDILGLAFNPYDPPSPVRIYVAHSLIYSKGGGPFAGPFPYIGMVSVITGPNFNGSTPLITGLPTSNHDHALNGMQFDNNGDLLMTVGSNTNAGVKYPTSGDTPESPLSAAVLKAETSRPDFNGAITYVTTSTGIPNDDQVLGELSDVAPGCHVHVQAPGTRNPYDIVYTTSKRLYATDNGPNTGFGVASTGPNTQSGEPSQPDELLLLEYDNYYGSPNRSRGRTDARQNIYRDTSVPSIPNQFAQTMITISAGTGGICEYRADTFLGQMRGNLLVQKWNSSTRRVVLSSDGRTVISTQTFGPNMSPLDIQVGPGGAMLAMDYTSDEVHVAVPSDLAALGLTAYDIFPWRAPSTGGQPFVIGGAHFGTLGNTTVSIGGLPATITSVSPTRIRGVLPVQPSPTTALLDVVVTSGATSDTLPAAFRYLFPTPGHEPGAWSTTASIPQAMSEVACGEINGVLYAVGGSTFKTYALDVTTRLWSQKPNRPFPGDHHAVEVVNGKLYVIGGLLNGAEGMVQIYDPVANSWSLGAPMPWAGGSVSTAVIGGKIYAAGGIASAQTVDLCAVYDPVANTWTSKQSLPFHLGRNHAAGGTNGSRFFVFGGRGFGSGNNNTVANGFDTVEIYDPIANTWITSADVGSTLAPLPIGRGGMGHAVYYQGEFYVMGGETLNGPGANAQNTYDRVDVYNPVTNLWRLEAPMPTARHGIWPVLFQSRIFVTGGGPSSGLSQSITTETFTRQ